MSQGQVTAPPLPVGERVDLAEEDLLFDPENPRLIGHETADQSELLKILWKEMSVDEVAISIAANGYFPQEFLLVVRAPMQGSKQKYYVAEGNRRLAAVKLLRDKSLRDLVRATSLPDISAAAREKLQTIPCLLYKHRKEIWRYTGFRHINGVKPWDSYAKAEYIAQIQKWEPKFTLSDISRYVGDQHETVRRMFQGYKVIEQARKGRIYDVDKNPEAVEKFSHLYTGIGYPTVRKYLGLSDVKYNKENPVDKKFQKNLGNVMDWLYGDKERGTKPLVVSQNPDLRKLAEAIGNPKSLEALEAGRVKSLDEAVRLAESDLKRFGGHLRGAESELAKAKSLSSSYHGDAENIARIETIAKLAADLHNKMKAVAKSR